MGTRGRRALTGPVGGRSIAARRRRLDETRDVASVTSVAHALERPSEAQPAAILALQRLAGNEAVVQLAKQEAEVPVNPPPGPYRGRRMRNDKMDWFEDHQNLFGPGIFNAYGPYSDPWVPLARLIERYWQQGADEGIGLETADQRVAAWVIVERFHADKAATLRHEKAGKQRDEALMDAVWGEFRRQYGFARDRSHAEWLRGPFRLYHEWLAVRFGRVEQPYAWWTNRKVAP